MGEIDFQVPEEIIKKILYQNDMDEYLTIEFLNRNK